MDLIIKSPLTPEQDLALRKLGREMEESGPFTCYIKMEYSSEETGHQISLSLASQSFHYKLEALESQFLDVVNFVRLNFQKRIKQWHKERGL